MLRPRIIQIMDIPRRRCITLTITVILIIRLIAIAIRGTAIGHLFIPAITLIIIDIRFIITGIRSIRLRALMVGITSMRFAARPTSTVDLIDSRRITADFEPREARGRQLQLGGTLECEVELSAAVSGLGVASGAEADLPGMAAGVVTWVAEDVDGRGSRVESLQDAI